MRTREPFFYLLAVVGLASLGVGTVSAQDDSVYSFLLFEQLEFRSDDGPDFLRWDVQNWLGDDYNKLWIKTEGEQLTRSENGDVEVQALFSRLVAPFWDLQLGLRYDAAYGPGPTASRAFAVIGLQGLAPYWFELEPALFVSDDGDVSGRVTALYDMLFTQRLILQPRFETNIAMQSVEEFGVGSGFNDVDIGLRLRYEIRREFAPYVGFSWLRKLGETAELARDGGEGVSNLAVVAGLRFWF